MFRKAEQMDGWKQVMSDIEYVSNIEKCVGEYTIWDVQKVPAAKYKVKVYENVQGEFIGYANLKVLSVDNEYEIVTAKGRTLDEAFNNTLARYYTLIEKVDVFDENAIQYTEDAMF